MRPRDKGETTLMVCCGHEIECTLERHQEWHQTIVYAVWRCNRCFTTYWYAVGEIQSRRAEPIVIAGAVVGPVLRLRNYDEQRRKT